FQTEAMIPAQAGWDPWYYAPAPQNLSLPQLFQQQVYQRYALNVYTDATTPISDYTQRCCYRKCLGLLRFSEAIADYFDLLDAAIQEITSYSMRLRDIVPAIECGNEMNHFYDTSDPAAAMEMGRFHALLAGPIMARGLGLRARLGELFCYLGDPSNLSDWDSILAWLRDTITEGMASETVRWLYAAYRPFMDPLWASLAREAGWKWWTSADAWRAGDLVHEVGFHWFTWTDGMYRAETDLRTEVAKMITTVCTDVDVHALTGGRDLTWSCCVGFMGSRPSVPITHYPRQPEDDTYYENNTLAHQGGMLVRRMLAAITQATPPTFVTWYSSMDGLTSAISGWDLYSSTGIRNVLFIDTSGGAAAAEPQGPFPAEPEYFVCQVHAWRRPAWYALRRLAWLRARSAVIEQVYSNPDCGAMAIRLVARDGFLPPEALSSPQEVTTYRYAYVCWLDQQGAAEDSVAEWVLRLFTGHPGWEELPLVPGSSCGAPATPNPDALDFPGDEQVDWSATPQESWVEDLTTEFLQILAIHVLPAEPTSNPAPICVLCDHEVVGISLQRSGVAGPVLIESEDITSPPAGQVGLQNALRGGPVGLQPPQKS
ncbi:MAG: hypothetical protein ABIO70_13360, partial [Pseudomonadota bacterium]